MVISDSIYKFETPDNDEIIYASQGDSYERGSIWAFAIGNKYTYTFDDSGKHYYFDNSVMKKYNELDPWQLLWRHKDNIFNKYSNKLHNITYLEKL